MSARNHFPLLSLDIVKKSLLILIQVLSGDGSNYSSITMGSVVVKQGERILLSSSSPHQMTNTINKSLSLSMTPQQTIMGLCDSNSSSYRETTTKLVSSRKSIISNFTTNGFVELPDKPDNELNLIVESFTSKNATINSLHRRQKGGARGLKPPLF